MTAGARNSVWPGASSGGVFSVCFALAACEAQPSREATDVPDYVRENAVEIGVAQSAAKHCDLVMLRRSEAEQAKRDLGARVSADGVPQEDLDAFALRTRVQGAGGLVVAYYAERGVNLLGPAGTVDRATFLEKVCATAVDEARRGVGAGKYLRLA